MRAAFRALQLFRADPDAHEGRTIVETRKQRPQRLKRRDRDFTTAAAAGFTIFAITAAVLLDHGRPSPVVLATVIGTYALAAMVEFEVGFGSSVPTQLVLLPMLFVVPLGLVPACVVAGLLLADVPHYVRREAHPERIVVLVMSAWHVAGPVLVFAAFDEQVPRVSHWYVYLLALLAQIAFDFGIAAARPWYVLGSPPTSQLAQMVSVWSVDAALTPIGFFVAFATTESRFAYLACAPLILLLAVFARERRIRIDNAIELGHAYRGTALLLGDMVEADDEGTGAHSRDVVSLVMAVVDRLGLDDRTRRNAEFAALLHDVGKVRVPKGIINKPGPLDDEEWQVVKQHTLWGEEMLKAVGGILGDVGTIVRSCHERYDGTGYPEGLTGDEIPLVARVILACDTFSAMTTDRSYRTARPTHEAVAELRRHAGTQFDPDVVATLIEILGASETERISIADGTETTAVGELSLAR